MISIPPAPRCWICGDAATTREHTTNAAIIRIVCGEPARGSPWFFHDDLELNQPLQGLKSDLLKPQFDLCADCNNRRTQPHDHAVEAMIKWLMAHKPDRIPGSTLRPRAIFPNHPAEHMLRMHLYFVKKLGCLVMEARSRGMVMPLDLAAASKAILTGTAHPHLYLRFGRRLKDKPPIARSKADGMQDNTTGQTIGLDWCHYYGPFAVHVIYAEPVLRQHPVMQGVWHPRYGLAGIRLASINKPIPSARSKLHALSPPP